MNGNGGSYEYFVCRSGLCGLGSLPRTEVEAAVARAVAELELPRDFIETIRADILGVLEETQEADLQLRSTLRKQLAILGTREDKLLDLAADEELSTDKLKERIRTIKLERASIEERLSRTDIQISRGAQTLLTQLDLLAEPGTLYRNSTDSVRRQLVEAFFSMLLGNESDESIEVRGVQRGLISELRDAASPSIKSRSPRLSTRASALSTSADLLLNHFRGPGLNKAALVGLTGFEPATP